MSFRALSGLCLSFALAGCSNSHTGDEVGPGTEDTGVEVPQDLDGDGFTVADGDCDDDDPAIHPDAEEICDGIDNDCDGTSDADFDDDGDGLKDCADACPIYVDVKATASAQGGTFTDPFLAIQDAIDASPSLGCDVIRVRPGIYPESIDFLGYDLDVGSTKGRGLTTIQGDGASTVVTFQGGESSAAVLQGFTITGGGGPGGAGVYIDGSDPTLRKNAISGNNANSGALQGGGLMLINSSAWIFDNEITRNDAGYGGPEDGCDGGGLFVRGGAPVIEANIIRDNTAGDGGGLWLARSDALIINNWIVGNRAYDIDSVKGGQGGGLDIQIGTEDTLVSGNVIAENTASTHGGGIAIFEYAASEGDPEVSNNTIAFNEVTGTSNGAGLVGWQLTRGRVSNNVIYGNHGPGVWLNATTAFSYNCVYDNTTNYAGEQGSLTGINGNIGVDPRFTAASDDGDWTNDDWTPRSTSPLLGAGDPAVKNTDGSRSHMGATGGPFGL